MNPIKRQTSFPQPTVSDSKVSIKDQGTVNFAKTEDVATPGDPKPYGAGEMRGGGAAIRGKKFAGIFQQMFLAPQGPGMLPAPPLSSRFNNVTPERMQKAEEERRRYLERNNGIDKHNLADDIYNFMATQPGDQGHMTTGLPQPSIQPIQDRRARENLSGSLGGQIIAGPQQRGDFEMRIQEPPSSRPNPYSSPIRPGGMENLSGSLGGQIRPNPYSAPQIPQMGGGYGGGQGMQQFMQFMQTMMQMFQQLQGGGMSGEFQGQMRRPQTYGRSPYGGY